MNGLKGIVVNRAFPSVHGELCFKLRLFRFMQFNFGWYGHAIFKDGKYPEVMRRNIDRNSQLQGLNVSRLPEFTPEVKVFVCFSVACTRK